MRRQEKEILERDIIDKILKSSRICRLAIFDKEYPYIIPMNYGYHNNSLYFHCATQGKKIDLLKQNNKVGFEIEQSHDIIEDEESCKWTTKFLSIIGTGEIVIIKDKEAKKKGLDILMIHHGKTDNIYNENALKKVVILKLDIIGMTAKQSGN